MSKETTTGPTPMETILGGVEHDVRKLDGSIERVLIRQVPLRSMTRLLECQDDESRMIELFCDRPAGWSDGVANESAEQIVREGERINADFFRRWVGRRIERQERLFPGSTKLAPLPTGSLQSSSASPA